MSTSQQIWQQLEKAAEAHHQLQIKDLFDNPGRLDAMSSSLEGLYFDFSKHRIDTETFERLLQLGNACGVLKQAREMAQGATINPSEGRAALHMALRNPDAGLPHEITTHIADEKTKLAAFSQAVRNGQWAGATGKQITDVINIGIGGSDLGPRMVCSALREYHDGPTIHFISNVDGAEINTLLKTLDAHTTLIVISSKTFTTQETMLNAATALDWLGKQLGNTRPQATSQCVAITSNIEAATAFGISENRILTFTDAIGGRYSVWSSIGFSVCLALGFDHFEAMLAGGAIMDEHFLNAPPAKNMPLVMGLLGIWNQNFLGAQSYAVVPYCQRLREFVDHLQQLDMESNGKTATLNNERTTKSTGPIVWGQTGTNGQHAFFQLFHQGTRFIPVDFIGAIEDRLSSSEHHRILNANLIAQSQALMTGRNNHDINRNYDGNRPSSVLLLDSLTPKNLGMLLALYEHRVFVQSRIWEINPFDQWGVELGKELANEVLSGQGKYDPSTSALMNKTGLKD